MYKFKKKYQLWVDYGYEGWNFSEFDTIEECLLAERYTTDFAITKRVDLEVKENV